MDEHMRELRVLVDYRADLIKRRTGLISDPPRKNCWMLAEHARDHTPDKMQRTAGRHLRSPLIRRAIRLLARDTGLWHDDAWLTDITPWNRHLLQGADYRLSDSGPHEAGFVGEYHGLDAVP